VIGAAPHRVAWCSLSMKKHTILFLAANPSDTNPLALDREARSILRELEQSGHRDRFQLETRWAAEPLDLLRELRKLKPTVVHYSGHGGVQGLFFQGHDGTARVVSTTALEETFGAAGASVRVVVLNACYSEVHADALLAHVDCVVGTGGPILDTAARSFAVGFYGGLGEQESVAAAYRQGCAAISLEAGAPSGVSRDVIPEPLEVDPRRPQLRIRPGVDAEKLVLTADPR
jgi:CHAT domain